MPGYPCCCNNPSPLLECSRCLAGTTPYGFQVTLVRMFLVLNSSPLTTILEAPAGTYLCTQDHPLGGSVNGCTWYGPIVASYVDSTVPPSACNASGDTRYIFPVVYNLASGTMIYQWARSTGATSWTGWNTFSGFHAVSFGSDCGTINTSDSVSSVSNGGSFCIDGNHCGESCDAGTISAIAVP